MYSRREIGKQKRRLWLEGMQILNVLLVTAVFCVIWVIFYRPYLATPYFQKGIAVLLLIFATVYVALGRTYSAFKTDIPRINEVIFGQFLAEFFADFVMYFVTFLLTKKFPSVLPILGVLALQVIISVIWTKVTNKIYFSLTTRDKTVIIWDTRESVDDLIRSYGFHIRFDVVGTYSISEFGEDYENRLKGIRTVFLCGIHSHERNQIVKFCVDRGINVYLIPRIGDVIMSSAKPTHMFHLPMMLLERYNPSPFYLAGKRLFDFTASLLALIILSPLMIVIALIIRRDGGTAFYKQVRLTKNGEEFEVYKFRSMRMDAESDGVARLSTGENDDRITPIGHFIRACRIDELPQLINILKGEMSIVGPRPERPEIAAEYEKEMPEFALRLQAKAGLTGQAQVFGKYNTTPYDKLLMDLQYIASANIFEDLRIIFATIKILFTKESTEGVQEGQTTAMGPSVNENGNAEAASAVSVSGEDVGTEEYVKTGSDENIEEETE